MRIKDISKYLITHGIDSTAICTVVNPPMSALETYVVKMSNQVSQNARMIAALLTFGGIGFVFSRGRDLSRKLFNINQEKSEIIKQVHDTCYGIAYAAITSPPFYYLAGC